MFNTTIKKCIAAGMLLAAGLAQAEFPEKTVRLIVPTPPGNALDISARLIADRLAAKWKQAVIVENKAGGSGIPAMVAAKTAPADGYTIVVAPSSAAGINPGLFPQLPYDPLGDFDTIGGIYLGPIMVVANTKSPYRTLADVVAAAKKAPGAVAVAYGGPLGSTQHLSTQLFSHRAEIDVLGVPYKGSAPAMQDLLGGQVEVLFDSVAAALPHIAAGTVRPLAVATAQRMTQIQNVPTIAELGYPDFEAVSWGGLLVPRGTPPSIIARIEADVLDIVRDPAVRTQLLSRGLVPDTRGSLAWRSFMEQEVRKWGNLIKIANIKAE